MENPRPGIEVIERAPCGGDADGLAGFCRHAVSAVLGSPPGPGEAMLGQLDEVVVVLVADGEMARLHARFSGIPGPTDVLTFHHGEIVVSVDTAASQAPGHGVTTGGEIRRYIVHGLLHLHGYLDADPADRRAMHGVQEAVLAALAAGAGDA